MRGSRYAHTESGRQRRPRLADAHRSLVCQCSESRRVRLLILRHSLLPYVIRITTRAANVSDTDIIARFNSQMAWETEQRRLDPECVRAGVRALLLDAAKGTYFLGEVAESGEPFIAGQLLITYEWSDWRNGNFWWIQSVYVAKEFRGKGVFRALFNHVHTMAKARNDVCGLRLYMDAHNAGARRTYEQIGFELTNYEMFEMDFTRKPLSSSTALVPIA